MWTINSSMRWKGCSIPFLIFHPQKCMVHAKYVLAWRNVSVYSNDLCCFGLLFFICIHRHDLASGKKSSRARRVFMTSKISIKRWQSVVVQTSRYHYHTRKWHVRSFNSMSVHCSMQFNFKRKKNTVEFNQSDWLTTIIVVFFSFSLRMRWFASRPSVRHSQSSYTNARYS